MKRLQALIRWIIRSGKRSGFILKGFNDRTIQGLNLLIPVLLFICFGIVIYDFGFSSFRSNHPQINFALQVLLDLVVLMMGTRIVLEIFVAKKPWVRVFSCIVLLFLLAVTVYFLPQKAGAADTATDRYATLKLMAYTGVAAVFILEGSRFIHYIYARTFNPGLLLVYSFSFLIIAGTFLLKLPNATQRNISVMDAFFTAASAVCITGLTVVDTATQFTPLGHLVIMLLIQAGGLGIMTFAGIMAYAIAGQASIRTQLAFKDIVASRKINNVMHFLFQVVFVTLLFETAGAIFIYFTVSDDLFVRKIDRIFFAVFHSVSSFCNAGFSTYSMGLYAPALRFNYGLHIVIAIMVILGGLGFPIVFNFYNYLRIKMANQFRSMTGDPRREHFPSLNFVNAKLAMMVSVMLLLIGFTTYLLFEQQATLTEHPTWYGKLITGFFASVTPRSGGFSTVDLSGITLPTVLVYLLLMYIGASPGSTGGGIKTTTAGLAVLNLVAVLQGKDRTEFYRSEISHQSVRRAFAIIILSLMCMGVSVFLISLNDSSRGLLPIAFEVFSAFSTTGLSLGITPELTIYSKLVIIVTMFVGRIGMITILVAFIKQSAQLYYRYPKEDIAF